MAKNENAAQGAAVAEETAKVIVTGGKLVTPEVLNIIGTVVGISERAKGGKFKHDTKIVTIEDVKTGEFVDVFITARQWSEYKCGDYCYMNNVINVAVEDCKANVTGYIAQEGDVEMTAHEHDFKAFNRALNASIQSLAIALSKQCVDHNTIAMLTHSVQSVRLQQSRPALGGNDVPFMG